MIVKNVSLTLLKAEKKEGKGKKSGKDYLFYTATVVDEDANVFTFNLSDSITENASDVVKLLEVRNQSVTADIEFKPKGFDIGGRIVEFN